MSQDKPPVPPLPPIPQQEVTHTLVITLTINSDGKGVNISGPILDRGLCYEMLGSAFEALIQQALGKKGEKPSILLPRRIIQ